MNLADSVNGGDDSFKLLLNYRGKHTFTQEPCVYDGERRFAYDVMMGKTDFFIVAPTDALRDEVFNAFDRFLENMLKYTTEEENPYSAVLSYDSGKLKPALTLDVSVGYGVKTALLIFGLKGETMLLGYDRDDLGERLRKSFSAGFDLALARRGDEKTIKGIFGEHDLAVLTPPDEEDSNETGKKACDGGGCPGGVEPEEGERVPSEGA